MKVTAAPTRAAATPARSAVQRLEASRTRLRNALQHARGQMKQAAGDEERQDGSLFDSLRRSSRRVWARHPLRAALRFARQTVGATLMAELTPRVREHPWKSLAIAAGVGAAVVWARPWRLLPRAALGSVLLSFMLPRRAIWQELMASGLIERLVSAELWARAFGNTSAQPTQDPATTAAPSKSPTTSQAGARHATEPAGSDEHPPADGAQSARSVVR